MATIVSPAPLAGSIVLSVGSNTSASFSRASWNPSQLDSLCDSVPVQGRCHVAISEQMFKRPHLKFAKKAMLDTSQMPDDWSGFAFVEKDILNTLGSNTARFGNFRSTAAAPGALPSIALAVQAVHELAQVRREMVAIKPLSKVGTTQFINFDNSAERVVVHFVFFCNAHPCRKFHGGDYHISSGSVIRLTGVGLPGVMMEVRTQSEMRVLEERFLSQFRDSASPTTLAEISQAYAQIQHSQAKVVGLAAQSEAARVVHKDPSWQL